MSAAATPVSRSPRAAGSRKGEDEMKRMLLLAGLLGAATVAVVRLLRVGQGTLRDAAGRAAEVVREKGPGVSDRVAQGIEELGEVAEKGAEEVRQRVPVAQEGSDETPPQTDEEGSPDAEKSSS
jgi:sugar phosphate isomerase/epimerase